MVHIFSESHHDEDNFVFKDLDTGEIHRLHSLVQNEFDTFSDRNNQCERTFQHSTEVVPEIDGKTLQTGRAGVVSRGSSSLNSFILQSVIGKGSFGKVVLVKSRENDKYYAMKILSKAVIIRRNQIQHTLTERRVLGSTNHPFIVKLQCCFQTQQKLYFVMEYCQGGELFFHLSRLERFPENIAKFYAAEIVLAVEHLHKLGIIFRDLKPENILLDHRGHVKLADFGLAKDNVFDATSGARSLCGTPEYIAPEVLARSRAGYGFAVDWWALGMVLYEMLSGLPPWYTTNRKHLFRRIREDPLVFPRCISASSKSIIIRLLDRCPSTRLGSRTDASEVKGHPFFSSISFEDLIWSDAPFKPCKSDANPDDISNFEKQFTDIPLDYADLQKAEVLAKDTDEEEDVFKDFAFEGLEEI